ncbi:MAG: hypothetical protein II039_12010, partial [Treponema sp.]|nr:hypothetical protein [Treponema sp.]
PLEAPWAAPGTKVILEGASEADAKPEEISADDFFKVQINVVDGSVQIAGKKLTACGKSLETVHAKNGGVN